MTINEKAKAYDNALKIVEKYKDANIMFTQDLKEEMFPKLKESEEEKKGEREIIIGSHNSWTYLRPRKWWMRLLAFTARCQRHSIEVQYKDDGVRCFDLRVRFNHDLFVMAHGIIEYDYSRENLYYDLWWLDVQARTLKEKVYVRVINEIRNDKDYYQPRIRQFQDFCEEIEQCFPYITFWCGTNLLPRPNIDYLFDLDPSCEERYASVCAPRIIDDWWPWWYARFHNKENIANGTDKDILLIDFVDIR